MDVGSILTKIVASRFKNRLNEAFLKYFEVKTRHNNTPKYFNPCVYTNIYILKSIPVYPGTHICFTSQVHEIRYDFHVICVPVGLFFI